MNFRFQFWHLRGALLAIMLILVPGFARSTPPDILWTGPETNFTQSASNFTDVLLPGAVSMCRNYSQWLFNPDGGDPGPGLGTPSDTLWAFGLLTNYAGLTYKTFDKWRDGDLSSLVVSNPMVVQLVNEHIYLSLTFSAWPQYGGFFSYTRSTPAVVAQAPTVAITKPTNGTVYAVPANVNIVATATVASGSVSNVAFFANSNLLGTSQSPPFSITAGNMAAGHYSLMAVATAAGMSATSAVVNITVVIPTPITFSPPKINGTQVAFNYAVNPGLGYVVQGSSNLVNWLPLATNFPTSNSVQFIGNFSPEGARYFRVGRLPNP